MSTPGPVPPLVILAADIGGTHARFRLVRREAGRVVVLDDDTLLVAAHDTVEAAASAFLARSAPAFIDRACLAVAGPIEGRVAHLTNASWRIDADAVATRFGIGELVLCNDFEAAAFGLDALSPSACVALQAPDDSTQPPAQGEARRLLIGAGTGLGVAYVFPEPRGVRVIAGEGGHVGFAPADDEQAALLAFLRPELGRVTAEHVLSGAGLSRLYRFVRGQRGPGGEDAVSITRRFGEGEPDAVHAVEMFASILGAVAGDHALSILATGGVFIAGGIAPRFAATLAAGGFIEAFRAKGVHAALMRRMPVHLVSDDRLGLQGAVLRALA